MGTTREIALHCMKSASELERELCEECPIYGQTGCDHCFEDALQYVIGMLEQEPTTKNNLGVDCVERQDVERYIEGFINEYTTKEELEFINLELDGLKHLPPVTPQEPRWIPVSEKLPEPFTFVNATCRSLVDDRENWVVETIYLPIPKEANKRGYSDWGNIPMLNWGEAEVIAWVERIIPQPYKEEVEP